MYWEESSTSFILTEFIYSLDTEDILLLALNSSYQRGVQHCRLFRLAHPEGQHYLAVPKWASGYFPSMQATDAEEAWILMSASYKPAVTASA